MKKFSPQTFMWCGSFIYCIVIIDISFDLYLSIGSESIETQMYTFVLPTHVISLALSTGWSMGLKKILTSPGWELEFPTVDLIIERNYLTETFPQNLVREYIPNI